MDIFFGIIISSRSMTVAAMKLPNSMELNKQIKRATSLKHCSRRSQTAWSCGMLLSTQPTMVGCVDNKVPQLHATQSESLD